MSERVKPASSEPIPKEYQKLQWTVMAHTTSEGGDWIEGDSYPANVSAIRYQNGWIYDYVLLRLGESPWRHTDDLSVN